MLFAACTSKEVPVEVPLDVPFESDLAVGEAIAAVQGALYQRDAENAMSY